MEIGILFKEKPLIDVGFYRKNEALTENTKKKIFIGIYSMISEIFKNQVLRKVDLNEYTVLFYGINIRDPQGQMGIDISNLILNYMIIDLEENNIDSLTMDILQGKMAELAKKFLETYKIQDLQKNEEISDFTGFKENILLIYKDLIHTPEERFDKLWG